MKSNLQRNLNELQNEVWEVNQAIEGISDILYLPRLSMGEVEDNYEETIDFIERKQQAILDYEAGYQQEVQELHELTSATRGMIREYRDKDRASETYESGDYAKSAAIESLAVSMGNYIRYTEEHASELKKAAENQERIQQEKEEKERAKERKKEGLWQTAGGLLSVAAGGFAIAATAGAATPVIVTVGTGAIGGVNVAYGAAETIEGVQETYYGVTGDGKSASVNYLRDVVFGGKENIYATVGTTANIAAAVVVPGSMGYSVAVKNGTSAAKGVGSVLAYTGISTGVGMVSENLAKKAGATSEVSMAIGMATSLLTAKGIPMGEKFCKRAIKKVQSNETVMSLVRDDAGGLKIGGARVEMVL